MKEIGGYFELERYSGQEYHKNALALNCGRNCLAYLIEARNIQCLYLPWFLCSSLSDTARKYGVTVKYYNIDNNFRPRDVVLNQKDYFYLMNYYGQITNNEILEYQRRYPNLIVDNSQAFFQHPVEDVDTLYTCRKYFGVADGAYLYTNKKLKRELPISLSYSKMEFILGRYECSASDFFPKACINNESFANEPVAKMSKLTKNLLSPIDYERVASIRRQNYSYLSDKLANLNELHDLVAPEGPFMYPLLCKSGKSIRNCLQKQKIYIPTLWPEVINITAKDTLEHYFAENILPLPIDQRYGLSEMKEIVESIVSLLV